jgi:hypothetical protein
VDEAKVQSASAPDAGIATEAPSDNGAEA